MAVSASKFSATTVFANSSFYCTSSRIYKSKCDLTKSLNCKLKKNLKVQNSKVGQWKGRSLYTTHKEDAHWSHNNSRNKRSFTYPTTNVYFWWTLMCCLNLSIRLNSLRHPFEGHRNLWVVPSSCTASRWRFNPSLRLNVLSQWLHWYGLSPVR